MDHYNVLPNEKQLVPVPLPVVYQETNPINQGMHQPVPPAYVCTNQNAPVQPGVYQNAPVQPGVYQNAPVQPGVYQNLPIQTGVSLELVYRGQMQTQCSLSTIQEKHCKDMAVMAIAMERIKNQKCCEKIEYLQADTFCKCTVVCTGDGQGGNMNARIFMDAILNEVHAYCDNAGGKGAYIEVKPQGSVESIWIAICEKDLNSKELVDKIQVQGTRIVAKYSKQHKADILNAHIKQQMKADELLFPRQRVQWYIDGQILKYADASTWTSIDSDAIRSRCIACSDYFVESDLMICQIAKLTEVFVDKSYGMLMILSCMGGFMKSLLLRTDWFPDSAICFCGNGVSIMPVLNAFISYWVDYPPKVVSAMMSEKDFVRELAETGDELFVVDCGFEITASHYRESQRKSNIQIATRWGTQGCNCFPILVSNNLLDICRMDNIVPLILNSGDMEWDILIEANTDNTCLANFVQLIRCYIEERGVAVQDKIDKKVLSQYASVQKEQLKQPGLIAIFRTIHSLIVDIIREECSDEENCNLFDSLCADALALLKVYLDFPSGDIIAEEFQETMNQLTNKGYFLYCDRYDDKVSEQEDCEKCYIYYDSSYLYMSLADFKSVVLTDMRECEKNASKILGYLEHSGFLSGYDNAKDFCVDVLIKSKPKRRSMLRFNRDKFQSIGGLDIIYRGGNYE